MLVQLECLGPAVSSTPALSATVEAGKGLLVSMFGRLDTEKRLWIQHGLDKRPEVIATGVKSAQWGPISHRVMVEEMDGKARVYDGRDQSWIDLGIVAGAQWSPDENRLLFVSSEGTGSPPRRFLSVLIGRKVSKLSEIDRIGELRKAAVSADGERAFLSANLAGKFDVWMISLTPRVPLPTTPIPLERPRLPAIIGH